MADRLNDIEIHERLVNLLNLTPHCIDFDDTINGPVWYGFKRDGSLMMAADVRASTAIPGKSLKGNGIRVVDVTGDCWDADDFSPEETDDFFRLQDEA